MGPSSRVSFALVSLIPVFVLASPAPAPAPQVLSSLTSEFANATVAAASALPSLLIPSYSNFTGSNWNVRFYGLAYKLINISTSDLDSIIDGLSTNNLSTTQQSLLQNRTQDLTSIPIPDANLTAMVSVNGSSVTNSSGLTLQTTDAVGEIDQFIEVPGLGSGDITKIQIVQTGILNITGPGNGTTILVPTSGISVVSDIDDVLRITKVYVPNQGLFNSFVQPYVNVPGFHELFAKWASSLPCVAFHYDTTAPVELTRTYVEYLQDSLTKLYQTFPQRKFVLTGDTSSSTLLSAYPQITTQFPNQTACIFIRNTSATDSDDKIPYSMKAFQNISSSQYFFYRTPDDLMNIDVSSGNCVNQSVPQNVTVGEQGGFLDGAAGRSASAFGWGAVVVVGFSTLVGLLGV
ncbi:hypothetical protein EUX98_g5977 [Antrodiella citrinella]|uniref:Phosphatidate phosphatase APP1 catalytic domain-containing protein n=1 Tax=Antrodiella citrinella TaxID=2447956 RepID=A0A4S4MQG3_9APHY|nr:hypothetical protein EUX98_g5977 [Antrodiella citrinella]